METLWIVLGALAGVAVAAAIVLLTTGRALAGAQRRIEQARRGRRG
ncbi:hypothetical protein [Pseudonocardia sp. TRM90224]|nr:hypothetical protein [Pseudonocardia sp. TRM90224]